MRSSTAWRGVGGGSTFVAGVLSLIHAVIGVVQQAVQHVAIAEQNGTAAAEKQCAVHPRADAEFAAEQERAAEGEQHAALPDVATTFALPG